MHLNELIHATSDEQIIYTLRRHPITFVPTILLFAFLATAVPWMVRLLLTSASPDLFLDNGMRGLAVLGTSFYYLSLLVLFFGRFVDYYLDMWVVTNRRLIDIDQIGLFGRSVSEVELYKVQDIRSDQRGFFATIFNFGNISVETSGAELRFMVHQVANPNGLRREVLELIREDAERQEKL